MLNIYAKYKLKSGWSTWRKFSQLNVSLQRQIREGGPIAHETFALLMILNEQYSKWYNLALWYKKTNRSVLQKLEAVEHACAQFPFSNGQINALKNQTFFKRKLWVIIIRTIGLDYLIYSETLRTNKVVKWAHFEIRRNVALTAIHISFYYVLPIVLINISAFLVPLLIASILYNSINSYRKTKINYYQNLLISFLKIKIPND